MIVAKLMGGLGNQMFQYAAALSLANKHNTQAKVDLSFLNADPKGQYTKRHFELSVFEQDVPLASNDELAGLNRSTQNRWQRLFSGDQQKWNLALEVHPGYNDEFQNLPDHTYLQGFWQSEKYFAGSEDRIRKAFVFSKPVLSAAEPWIEKIGTRNSVSLHIRRGDYASRTDAQQYHGLLPLSYYHQALELIRQKHSDLEIFVFSDDPAWCRSQFTFTEPTHFVETNVAAAELFLMSKCKHQVIANSSFSWWAAWLNSNGAKIVVAPKQWNLKDSTFSKDIYCKGWNVL